MKHGEFRMDPGVQAEARHRALQLHHLGRGHRQYPGEPQEIWGWGPNSWDFYSDFVKFIYGIYWDLLGFIVI